MIFSGLMCAAFVAITFIAFAFTADFFSENLKKDLETDNFSRVVLGVIFLPPTTICFFWVFGSWLRHNYSLLIPLSKETRFTTARDSVANKIILTFKNSRDYLPSAFQRVRQRDFCAAVVGVVITHLWAAVIAGEISLLEGALMVLIFDAGFLSCYAIVNGLIHRKAEYFPERLFYAGMAMSIVINLVFLAARHNTGALGVITLGFYTFTFIVLRLSRESIQGWQYSALLRASTTLWIIFYVSLQLAIHFMDEEDHDRLHKQVWLTGLLVAVICYFTIVNRIKIFQKEKNEENNNGVFLSGNIGATPNMGAYTVLSKGNDDAGTGTNVIREVDEHNALKLKVLRYAALLFFVVVLILANALPTTDDHADVHDSAGKPLNTVDRLVTYGTCTLWALACLVLGTGQIFREAAGMRRTSLASPLMLPIYTLADSGDSGDTTAPIVTNNVSTGLYESVTSAVVYVAPVSRYVSQYCNRILCVAILRQIFGAFRFVSSEHGGAGGMGHVDHCTSRWPLVSVSGWHMAGKPSLNDWASDATIHLVCRQPVEYSQF